MSDSDTMMLALLVEPFGDGWRWLWYNHASGVALAHGDESTETLAWTAATRHYLRCSDALVRSLVARTEAAEARANASAGAALAVAHACEATRRRTLEEVIDLLDTRAVQRSAQVDVAQEAGGRWEVVAGKGTELMAVADLLRARLPPSTGGATS